MKIVKERIGVEGLQKMALETFGDMVKAVVDVDKSIMAIGGEMHADGEEELMSNGSKQSNLWGINLYPNKQREDMIVFESLINVRPAQGNSQIEIEDKGLKEKITKIVNGLVE